MGGGEITRKKISKNTRLGYSKIFEKKSSGESTKTRFFFIKTRTSWQKNRGKNAINFFFRNIRISRAKNDGKKSS